LIEVGEWKMTPIAIHQWRGSAAGKKSGCIMLEQSETGRIQVRQTSGVCCSPLTDIPVGKILLKYQ
jgi:hypothetical protein